MQRRANNGAELCVFGNDEADTEAIAKGLENVADRFNGSQITYKDDILNIVATCCKNGKHCNGFGNHVGNSESKVGACCHVRNLTKVCGSEVFVNTVVGVVLCDILDAQVYIIEISVCLLLLELYVVA